MGSVANALMTDLANASPQQQQKDIHWVKALLKTATGLAATNGSGESSRRSD